MVSTPEGPQRSIWPLSVRLAHWALVAMVVYTWIDDSGGRIHRWIGYAAAATVALRLTMGLLASPGPVRPYVPGPRAIKLHVLEMLTGRVERLPGHNPLGMGMSLLIWAQVAALALSGWISRWDMFWGEELPQNIHACLSTSLQICVALHLLGVALTSFLERQNLVLAMINGRKCVDADKIDPDSSIPSSGGKPLIKGGECGTK